MIKYRDKTVLTVEVVSVQCPQCTHTACCVVVVLCCVLWAYLCHPRPACFPLLSFPKFPNKIRLLLSHALLHNNNVKDSFTFRPRRLGPKVQLQSSQARSVVTLSMPRRLGSEVKESTSTFRSRFIIVVFRSLGLRPRDLKRNRAF